jgi:hypothetical protein
MKTKTIILILSVIAICSFSRCKHCSSCLADGESFNLPYSSNQTVNFSNDSQVVKSYLVQTAANLPPDQYCGPIGSQSYMYCAGQSSATLRSGNDSIDMIWILNDAGTSDEVELYVTTYVTVVNSRITIIKGIATVDNHIGNVITLGSISVNGIQYNNVYVFQNDLAEINNCSYFVYSPINGILKYTLKKANSLENWVLKN